MSGRSLFRTDTIRAPKRTKYEYARPNRSRPEQRAIRSYKQKMSKPRFALTKQIAAPPHTYPFRRSHDSVIHIGKDSPENLAYMNTDQTYMCIQLHSSWEQLPGCKDHAYNDADGLNTSRIDNDFKQLFSQYKITSIHHTLTPNYSTNQFYMETTGHQDRNIPNYEMWILPGNWVAGSEEDNASLHTKSQLEIDAWLNSTNRKSRRILPSTTQTFKCNSPSVVKYDAITSHKHAGYAATTKMGPPEFYNTDPDDTPSGTPRPTGIRHYTYCLLIRRVDGKGFGADAQALAGGDNALGFRLSTEVGFLCRATPKDIMKTTLNTM